MDYNRIENVDDYTKQLQKLVGALKEEGPKSPKVTLLHDNARSYTTKLTLKFLEKME